MSLPDNTGGAVPSDLPQAHADTVAARTHLLDQENAPKRYKAEDEPAARAAILEHLRGARLLYLAGVGEGGWPFGLAAPLAVIAGDSDRPVLYVTLPRSSPDVERLRADPRASASTYKATGFENRREAKGLQLQVLATVLPQQEGAAFEALADTSGQPSLQPEGGTSPAERVTVRLDALAAVFFDASGRPQWGFLDYAGTSEPHG